MARTTNKARGGFFFAVMALAILSLVLMTVQVWVKTSEQADYHSSQRFKGEAMRSVLASLSDKTLAEFANASAFYATYKMVNRTSNQGLELGQAPGTDEKQNKNTGLVENITIGLMTNGSSPSNWGYSIEYSNDEKNAYTLEGWKNRTDAAANAMGFDIQFSDAKNFRYYQIDAWTVGVSFDMDMNITDREGTMRQNKAMRAESNFSIEGFLDPMVTRKDMEHRRVERGVATEKQIFKNDKYNFPEDVQPTMVKEYGEEGNGWFFGPITDLTPDEINSHETETGWTGGVSIENLKQYVLVSSYNDSLASIAESYGAVIVTQEPRTETVIEHGCNVTRQTNCLNCMKKTEAGQGCTETGWELFGNIVDVPVIAVTNWDTKNVTPVTRAQAGGGKITEYSVLIDNEKESKDDKRTGYHRVWDVTSLRDMAICGFYVEGNGPSFFQRMLTGAERINNQYFGIESFVVGQWAGGAIDKEDNYAADQYSRLDWEFYQGLEGNSVAKVKGMMGCKSKEMCSTKNATEMGLGHFRLSDEAATRYLSEDISCKATPSAPCE
ncbi:MAG: hypothetical protein WCY41_00175 [Candidatus Micrarchaeia archaeon]